MQTDDSAGKKGDDDPFRSQKDQIRSLKQLQVFQLACKKPESLGESRNKGEIERNQQDTQ